MKLVARLYQRVAHRGDERGAIMIMAVLGLVVMVMSASLSIDIGRISLEKKQNQSVADLAALDAARDRNNALALAQASAVRNGFALPPTAPDHSVTVRVGSLDSHGAFVPNVGSTAVEATVTSVVKYMFQVGSRTITARAVAAMQDKAGFWIGSNLVSISTDQSTLLNNTIGPMIGAPGALSITTVGWQGLLSASLTLNALSQQLVNAGLNVGSLDTLMSTDITIKQLYTASAQVLTNQGLLAQAAVLSTMATTASGSTHLTLGSLFSVSQGDPGTVMSSSLNVFQFVTGTAEVANGSNLINVGSGVTIPNVTSTTLSLQIIRKPEFYFGPVSNPGPSVTTGQVHLVVTPTLNVPITAPPLLSAKITGALPVDIVASGADGTLEAVACTNPQSITVGVDPKPVNETASATLQITALGLGLPIPVTVNASATVTGSHGDLVFAYPSEFSPPAASKHSGSNTIGLGSLASSANVTVAGVPVATAVNGLNAVLGSVDSLVVQPLSQALGLEIGSGDVAAISRECNVLGLVG